MTKQEMIKVLEENRELIENNNFQEFYDKIIPTNRHYFTDLFLKSGIDPLNYMTEIPMNYAYYLHIKEIKIPNNIKNIGDMAFYNCWSLNHITIPKYVKIIRSYTFEACYNLKSISLSKNVKSIDYGAFENCINLKNIYYEGSQEDWNYININENNSIIYKATIHYNSKI